MISDQKTLSFFSLWLCHVRIITHQKKILVVSANSILLPRARKPSAIIIPPLNIQPGMILLTLWKNTRFIELNYNYYI